MIVLLEYIQGVVDASVAGVLYLLSRPALVGVAADAVPAIAAQGLPTWIRSDEGYGAALALSAFVGVATVRTARRGRAR